MPPDAMIDLIGNGNTSEVISGLTEKAIIDGRLEVGLLRPYFNRGKDKRWKAVCNIAGREVLVKNATLRKDEWVQYDSALIQAARIRLRGVADLQKRGLVYNIANGFGKTVLEYENASALGDAEVNMDGVSRANNERVEFNIKSLPLPLIHKAFSLNARVLASSRSTGDPLDTTQVSECTFKVAEKIEEILFRGASAYSYGGGVLRGYCDAPQRITGSLSDNWDDMVPLSMGDSVGTQILSDVLRMKQASIDAGYYGPWVLYIPTNYETTLDGEFSSGYPKSIRVRLLEISGIEDIIVADKIASDNVVLAQMTPNVVRLVTGMPISNVEWQSEGGMVHHFKVMAIMVPQIREDANGKTGVVHFS